MIPSSILDTSVLIVHLRGDRSLSASLKDTLHEDGSWGVSVLSHYELHRVARGHELARLDRLWEECWTMSVTPDVAREAGRIWAELREDGYTIEIPDQFIAATARLHDVPVTTYNTRHFRWVRRLRVLHPDDLPPLH